MAKNIQQSVAAPDAEYVLVADGTSNADNLGYVTTTAWVAEHTLQLGDLSVASNAAATTSALSYNNSTGVFTFTPSDATLGGSGGGGGSGILNVVEDTTPQLGGTLDANSYNIDMGTYIITDAKVGEWDTAYGWGNHSAQGYLTAEADTLATVTGRGATTTTTAVIPFYYANQAAFPNATTYHGAIAHSHLDGAMYFAHAGNWVELANASELTNKIELTDISVSTAATASVSALTYNSSTGVFTFTPNSTLGAGGEGIALSDLSASTGVAATVSSLAYNNSTGVFTLTPVDVTNKIELTDISVTTAAAAATTSLAYNNTTGVLTYTPPDTDNLVSTTVTTDTLTLNNNMVENVYAVTGTTPALDPANGTIQTWTLSGNSTPTDSFSAGESITLHIDDGTAYTITWPTITWVNNAGAAPTLATTGYTVVAVWKIGTTLYGALVGDGT